MMGCEVGCRLPPSGSAVTMICRTPSTGSSMPTVARPSARTLNSVWVGSGAVLPAGRTTPGRPAPRGGSGRRRPSARLRARQLERGAALAGDGRLHGPGGRPAVAAARRPGRRPATPEGEQHAGQRGRQGGRAPSAEPRPRPGRRGGARRAVGLGPRGAQQLGLGLDDRHDAALQRGRRRRTAARRRAACRRRPAARRPRARQAAQVARCAAKRRPRRPRGRRARRRRRPRRRAWSARAHDVASAARPPSWLRIFSRPRRMRPFTVPIGRLEHRGDLRVREAAEVGELDHARLLGGQRRRSAARTSRASSRRAASTSVRSRRLEALLDALVAGPAAVVDRRERRSASIARLWTMPSTQVRTRAAGAVVARAGAPEAQEGLLDDVLGGLRFRSCGRRARRRRSRGARRRPRSAGRRPCARAASGPRRRGRQRAGHPARVLAPGSRGRITGPAACAPRRPTALTVCSA